MHVALSAVHPDIWRDHLQTVSIVIEEVELDVLPSTVIVQHVVHVLLAVDVVKSGVLVENPRLAFCAGFQRLVNGLDLLSFSRGDFSRNLLCFFGLTLKFLVFLLSFERRVSVVSKLGVFMPLAFS